MFKSKDILSDLKKINNDNNNDSNNNNNNDNIDNNSNNINNNNNKIINVRRKSDGFISFPKSVYDSPFLKDNDEKDEKGEKNGNEDKEIDKSLSWDYIDIQVYSTCSHY